MGMQFSSTSTIPRLSAGNLPWKRQGDSRSGEIGYAPERSRSVACFGPPFRKLLRWQSSKSPCGMHAGCQSLAHGGRESRGGDLGPGTVLLELPAQGRTVDELHREPAEVAHLAVIEDLDDARVVQRGGDASLLPEPVREVRVLVIGEQDFQRFDAVQAAVPDAVDGREAAAAEVPEKLVALGQERRDLGLAWVGGAQGWVAGPTSRRSGRASRTGSPDPRATSAPAREPDAP